MTKAFVRSILGLIIWGSAGLSVLQFSQGGELLGVIFAVVAVILLVMLLEGSVVDRLVGKPASRANMLILVAILGLVGINELWGLFLLPMRSGPMFLTQLVFTLGLLGFIVWTARLAMRLPKSE